MSFLTNGAVQVALYAEGPEHLSLFPALLGVFAKWRKATINFVTWRSSDRASCQIRITKPTRCTKISNLFLEWNSTWPEGSWATVRLRESHQIRNKNANQETSTFGFIGVKRRRTNCWSISPVWPWKTRPDYRNSIACEGPQAAHASPGKSNSRWRCVWSSGGMILTKETVVLGETVDGGVYGAVVERYWQRKRQFWEKQ